MGKGLDKFIAEINKEVSGIKSADKKRYYEQSMNNVIAHLTDICDDEVDNLMAQEHKTFARAWKFVTEKARDCAVNGCACIEDATVYGWIDEYLGNDDKAEIEAEEKRIEELKAKASSKAKASPKAKAPTPEKQVDLFGGETTTDDSADDSTSEETADNSAQLSIFDLM